ncbi:MAG: response regulator transcription factor [Bacteroidota bacterium]
MKKQVLLYGASLAVLILILKWVEYNYLIRSFTEEAYVGALAIIFTGFGIWAGVKWMHKGNQEVIVNTKPSEEVQKELEISNRELEVLMGMEEGLSNRQIAEKLFLSESTIKTHAANLFTKLNVSRRTQAVQQARKLGLIT